MDWEDGNDDEAEVNEFADHEGDEAVAPEFAVKDSILFVIDARAAMCEPGPGGTASPFSQSIACVLTCMKDRILGGERDLIGVLLYGTEETKVPNGQGFPHIYLLQDLEEPSARSLRALSLVAAAASARATGDAKLDPLANDVASDVKGASSFGHLGASAKGVDLGNVLWVTSILFNNSTAKNVRRRVYLMTNDDNPCAASPAARACALTRSRDLQDAHVWMEPFFFAPPPPEKFDLGVKSFWRELIGTVRANYKPPRGGGTTTTKAGEQSTTTNGDATTGATSATGDKNEAEGGVGEGLPEDTSDAWLHTCLTEPGAASSLIERVRRRAHRKRSMWSSELTLGTGYALSFTMVGIVRASTKPTAKKLEASSNEELLSQTTLMCSVHGHPLQREDVFKAYEYGGKWVYFDQAELAAFGSEEGMGVGGLTLLGFKDAAKLKIHHNLDGKNKFLEPTERVPGSTSAMAALVQSMHAKGKIAIARMINKRAPPRLVALLPQLLELDEPPAGTSGAAVGGGGGEGARVRMPCGLHLIQLPYAEDIRSVPKPPALSADAFSTQELDTARGLVRALTLPPERSPVGTIVNPASATHFAHLELLALQVPHAEATPIVDGTKPDLMWLEQHQGAVDAFRETFELNDVDVSGGDAKRQRTSGPKAEKASVPETLAKWMALHLAHPLTLAKTWAGVQGGR